MGRPKAKVDKQGRNVNGWGRFARLDHSIMASPAYRSLTPLSRSLLFEFISLENSKNNGSLWLSVRDAAARCGVVDLMTASRAIDDLVQKGFIAMTKNAYFSIKSSEKSRARCWRLTWLPVVGVSVPTNEWQQWTPSDPKDQKRMDRGLKALADYKKAKAKNQLPVLETRTMKTIMNGKQGQPVLDSHTAKPPSDAKQPKSIVRVSNTHSAVAIGSGSSSRVSYWWVSSKALELTPVLAACLMLSQNEAMQKAA